MNLDGNMLKPVTKKSVRGQVFRQLRDQLLRRTWPPGSKLPSEKELSQTMGVSRVSIREGIQHLVSLGILETRHGEGTFVRELGGGGQLHFNALLPLLVLDDIDILQVLEYRRIVEKGAAALAAERATDQDLAEMEAVYGQMVQLRDNVAEFARADLEFHLVLAKATGNPVIIKVNNVLRTILEISMENIVTTLKMEDGLHYHRLIIDAIRAHDAEAAESIMQEHVDRTIVRLKAEAGLAAAGTARSSGKPRASLVERLDLHRTFWARGQQPRPLASFRVGDFFFARHFQAALPLLSPGKTIVPEMLALSDFLPDYERMFNEAEELGQDGFWTAEPYTGIPWMEAILGCPVRAGNESFTSQPWLSSPAEALEKVHFDPLNPWLAKYLEFTAALAKRSRGRYPVAMPIMRGPTDMIGALLGQQQMVMALMDEDPQVMLQLIERVTLAFLSVIEAQRSLTPPFYGGQALGFYHIWAPGRAIWFQDDLSSLLSPKLYRQFFLGSARTILAGQDHTAVHLHPHSFFILDELLSLENLKAVQVNKDISGPGIREMMPVLARIMQTHGLILWGDLTVEDLELVKKNLPCRGLALNVVAPSEEEAVRRLAYIRNWE